MDPEQENRLLNNTRIDCLLQRGTFRLQEIFKNLWTFYQSLITPAGVPVDVWEDNIANGTDLIKLCLTKNPMLIYLQPGIVSLWDVTLTSLAIQIVSTKIQKLGKSINSIDEVFIKSLKVFRNEFIHSNSELEDDEFEGKWLTLKTLLLAHGDNSCEIDDLKNKLEKLGQKTEEQIFDAKSEFSKFNEKAKALFDEKKYNEAIDIYYQMLQLSKLLPEDQAYAFSHRSSAYLMLNSKEAFEMAKLDAERAIQLWPIWWEGYFRLGRAQRKLKDLQNAIKSFEKAYVLSNESKEVFTELSEARSQFGIYSRMEHLNPKTQPKSNEEDIEETCKKLGISREQLRKMQENPSNLYKGHQYRYGIGVAEDLEKAAAYYAKAAAEGNPEGMFYLGVCYEYGKGLERNYDESLYWLKKAATFEGKRNPKINSGIPEAQHLLGLKYCEGTGVEKNVKEAAKWYEKAAMIGLASSANNLGILYKHGNGVERSLIKAFHYFKLAAQGGDTQGMLNLANSYFLADNSEAPIPTESDVENGMHWLRRAAEKGDLIAAKELERKKDFNYGNIVVEALVNQMSAHRIVESDPLDRNLYETEITKAAQNGSWTANKLLKVWRHLDDAMEAFKANYPDKVISDLSKAIRLDQQVVKIHELFIPIIEEKMKTSPNELDVITCFLRLHSNKPSELQQLLFDSIKKFPHDEFLNDYCIGSFVIAEKREEALKAANHALTIHPKSLRFLYWRAIVCCLQKDDSDSLEALNAFLAVAPKDHDKVPSCHYRKAQYYYCRGNVKKFVESFEDGLNSEKDQLSCYLPYKFPMKDSMEKTYFYEKQKFQETANASNFNNISLNPQRKFLLIQQRNSFCKTEDIRGKEGQAGHTIFQATTAVMPNYPQPPNMKKYKKITLKEMDSTVDKVYNGFCLQAKIIDWSFVMSGISTVIEDDNGDIERLAIYSWPLTENYTQDAPHVIKTFLPNSTVIIINPYMRIARDCQSLIRVNSPEFITIDASHWEKKCSCCGKEAKVLQCSKCKMSRYCSKDCQKLDWNEFEHKKVCQYLKKYNYIL